MEAPNQRPDDEIEEIQRHKYFMSEETGCDVGWEAAERDWEQNHAENYRLDTAAPHRPSITGMLKKFFGFNRK